MISLIYETSDFIAVNKPAGVLTHPIKNFSPEANQSLTEEFKTENEEPTLVDWILEKYPEVKNVGDSLTSFEQVNFRPGIVHRLDRDTSGVILIARNQKFFEYLKNLFKNHQIKKTYLALVWGELEPKSGEIKIPIGIKTGTIKRTVWQNRAKDLKEAITEYRVVKKFKFQGSSSKAQDFSLVELTPKTGRTHQIRVHLASLGHPVVGDKLYGFKKAKLPFDLNRQFLHAVSLEFSLPPRLNKREGEVAGNRIKLEAELPEELKLIIDTLNEKS